MIAEDDKLVSAKMKDIRKIAQNIDKLYQIEGMREGAEEVGSPQSLNPYLTKQNHQMKHEHKSVVEHSQKWA